MNTIPVPLIIDFEVYLLMTMKIRLVNRLPALEAKLSEFGLSVDDAQHVQARVAEALGGETSRFEGMKTFLGISQDSNLLKYASVLWPEFNFSAIADESGGLESARYIRARGDLHSGDSPAVLPPWSADVTDFTQHFGPLTNGRKWLLSDKTLPGYEEYEFFWNEERYGVGFSWGLFLYAAKYWPED
ncbi:hypothetical protein [Mycobacterium sp. NPDC050853]|uniref:hypothetical protein n=1 Tax=Mycobacterium sp. NPDC050853 TaxID=3155160 RepID=UPI00340D2E1D